MAHAAVIDASAALQALLHARGPLDQHGALTGIELAAPHLIDPELVHSTRRLVRHRLITAAHGDALLRDFVLLPVDRFPHGPLLRRAWRLKENVSAYDAMYVALAQVLNVQLITCDARLARAAEPYCDVRVFG